MSSTFQWGEATFHVSAPSSLSRMTYWRLKDLSDWHQLPEQSLMRSVRDQLLWQLSSISNIEGTLVNREGEIVLSPFETFTETTVKRFISWVESQDESFIILVNGAIIEARKGLGDPDLQPPQELDPNV